MFNFKEIDINTIKKYDNKYHYTYLIYNKITGKKYIGVHSTPNILDKYMGSGKLIKEDIKKYGKENFIKFILEFFISSDKAFIGEQHLITKDIINDETFHNTTPGGNGGKQYYNKTIYEFINLKTGEEFTGNQSEFKAKYEFKSCAISRLINKNSNTKTVKNWILKGTDLSDYRLLDKKLYKIYNYKNGEIFEGNRKELIDKLKCDNSNISRLLSGRNKSINGWSLDPNFKFKKGPPPSEENFKFVHKDGRIEIMTKNDFKTKYNMTYRDLASAINKNCRIAGRILIK